RAGARAQYEQRYTADQNIRMLCGVYEKALERRALAGPSIGGARAAMRLVTDPPLKSAAKAAAVAVVAGIDLSFASPRAGDDRESAERSAAVSANGGAHASAAPHTTEQPLRVLLVHNYYRL